MQVKNVMTINVITLLPTMTFFETAKLFLEYRISGAPVVDKDNNLVGVLSEKDLFRAMYPSCDDFYSYPRGYTIGDGLEEEAKDAGQKVVGDIMSKRLITTTMSTHVLKIGGQMVATGIHRVPVVEGKKLVGMVSRGDIYRAILQKHYNLYSVPSKRSI